jgi:hypothetical protein
VPFFIIPSQNQIETKTKQKKKEGLALFGGRRKGFFFAVFRRSEGEQVKTQQRKRQKKKDKKQKHRSCPSRLRLGLQVVRGRSAVRGDEEDPKNPPWNWFPALHLFPFPLLFSLLLFCFPLVSSQRKRKKVSKMATKKISAVQWSWRDDGNVWKPFDADTNATLEAEYQKGVKKIKVDKQRFVDLSLSHADVMKNFSGLPDDDDIIGLWLLFSSFLFLLLSFVFFLSFSGCLPFFALF